MNSLVGVMMIGGLRLRLLFILMSSVSPGLLDTLRLRDRSFLSIVREGSYPGSVSLILFRSIF